jgi:GntR family transcriptional regulator/MocR family aminotransferase
MHLVALGSGRGDRAASLRAAREGLWAMPLSSCYLGPPARHGFVLGYGGTRSEEIPRAVRRFRRVVEGA